MVVNKNVEKKVGISISYITLCIQLLVTFLFSPFLLERLGKDEYGLYQLVGSTIQYLNLLGFGFSASYIRFYSRYEVNDDKKGIARLNGLFMTLFLLMSVFCLIIGLVLVINIHSVYSNGIAETQYGSARIIMIILVINMALTFPKSIFISNISAHEKFIFHKSVGLIHDLLNPLFQLCFIMIGFKSIGLAMATIVVSVIDFILYLWFNLRYLCIEIDFRNIDFSLLKEISTFTFFIFVNQVLDFLSDSNIDIFLIGRIKGASEVTVYSMGNKFVQLYYSIAAPISAVFVPQINRLVAMDDENKMLTDIFVKVGKLQFIVLFLILSGFIVWGKAFILFWIGDGYDGSYYTAVLIMAALTIALSQNIGIEIQRAKNKHQIRSIIYFIIAIANIFISIPLIKRFDSVGAAIGTAIALVLGTVVFMNLYYYFALNINVKRYWKNIIEILLKLTPAYVMIFLMKKFIGSDSIYKIIIEAIIYSLIYFLIIWIWAMKKEEKESIKLLKK